MTKTDHDLADAVTNLADVMRNVGIDDLTVEVQPSAIRFSGNASDEGSHRKRKVRSGGKTFTIESGFGLVEPRSKPTAISPSQSGAR